MLAIPQRSPPSRQTSRSSARVITAVWSLAILREVGLIGSFRFNDEMDDIIVASADGSLDVGAVITAEYPFTEALDAFAIAADASRSSKVLLAF